MNDDEKHARAIQLLKDRTALQQAVRVLNWQIEKMEEEIKALSNQAPNASH